MILTGCFLIQISATMHTELERINRENETPPHSKWVESIYRKIGVFGLRRNDENYNRKKNSIKLTGLK